MGEAVHEEQAAIVKGRGCGRVCAREKPRRPALDGASGGWLADAFLVKALSLAHETGGKVAMLLNLASLCHPLRTALWQQKPPARIYAIDGIVCWPERRRDVRARCHADLLADKGAHARGRFSQVVEECAKIAHGAELHRNTEAHVIATIPAPTSRFSERKWLVYARKIKRLAGRRLCGFN